MSSKNDKKRSFSLDIYTVYLLTVMPLGKRNLPCSILLYSRQKLSPSQYRIFTLSKFLLWNTNIALLNWLSLKFCSTIADKPSILFLISMFAEDMYIFSEWIVNIYFHRPIPIWKNILLFRRKAQLLVLSSIWGCCVLCRFHGKIFVHSGCCP